MLAIERRAFLGIAIMALPLGPARHLHVEQEELFWQAHGMELLGPPLNV